MPRSPSGVAQASVLEKSVATEQRCIWHVSSGSAWWFPSQAPSPFSLGDFCSGPWQLLQNLLGSLLGCQDYLLQASSRNFPFRRLFDDAWPTERRTASTSSSWPVTPTCFLTSESRSPRVALLELLSRQPRGRPITVLRIETHSQPQTVRHTEWTNGVQQRVWNIANPNGSHETCTRCFYFLAFFPSIEHDSIDSH